MGEQVAARINGDVAQLGEHLPCKQGVKGSNPSISTRNLFEGLSGEERQGKLQKDFWW